MNKRIPFTGIAAIVLGQTACNRMQAILIPGADYSSESIPTYDAIVGDFTYNEEDGHVFFYGPDCYEPFDATSALQKLDLERYLDAVLNKGIEEVQAYAHWDNENSTYNTDPAWLALNCDDFNELGSWLLAENSGDSSDSFAHISCLYFDTYLTFCTDQKEIYYQCDGY